MGLILLLIIIVAGIIIFINSRNEKKKQRALWKERQHEGYIPPMPVIKLDSVDGNNHLVVKNDSSVFFTPYEKGKAAWPGGVENFSVYYDHDNNHLLVLSLVQENAANIDFGEVDPDKAKKFLDIYQRMGGHIADHYELLTLNKVDSNDLNLDVKTNPAQVYVYTETSVNDGKKRIYFSPDPTSTPYKLLGLALSDAANGEKSVDISLEDSKGIKGSVYTILSEASVKDLQDNFA
jgi:hypothetical protein